MKNILSFTFAATAALFSASAVSAVRTSEGCFGSSTGLTFNATILYNSEGACGDNCAAINSGVFAMTNSTCWCGDELPPTITLASSDNCNLACPGYPADTCGGKGYWSVWLTGLTTSAVNADPGPNDTTSSSSKVSSTAASTAIAKSTATTTNAAGATIFITATAAVTTPTTSASAAATSSSGPSKTGIAIGVVAGLIAVAAIVGGIFFFVRRRNRREVEEEYRRNAAVSSFIAGGKPGAAGTSDTNSFADTRLEQDIMANRRMSDGSIMDNQDYSRRILKVTNA